MIAKERRPGLGQQLHSIAHTKQQAQHTDTMDRGKAFARITLQSVAPRGERIFALVANCARRRRLLSPIGSGDRTGLLRVNLRPPAASSVHLQCGARRLESSISESPGGDLPSSSSVNKTIWPKQNNNQTVFCAVC